MKSDRGGSASGRYTFSLSFLTATLVSTAVFLNLAVPHEAQSQISSKVLKAPAFSGDATHATTVKLPKALAQVEMPAPPPIKIFPGLGEPLVATGRVSEQEGRDLDAALKEFHDAPAKTGKESDFTDYSVPLISFIANHPNSNWNAALHLNLGLGLYHSGYYSRAFPEFEQAWKLGRDATSNQARLMTDRAVAELAKMHARVGHAKELENLFADIGKRPIGGSATEILQGAHTGLSMFQGDYSKAYLCGPKALSNVLQTLKASDKQVKIAEEALSGPHGYSLTQLARLADKTKFKYKLIHRDAGQSIPVPSVIHWKINHYAAVVELRDGYYVLKDPTFGDSGNMVTAKAIDAESDGYFLVPDTVMAANTGSAWRTLSAGSVEAKSVYGMGGTSGSQAGPVQPKDNKRDGCPKETSATGDASNGAPQRMTIACAHRMKVSLNLTDTPVGYQPQKGGSMETTVTYNQREEMQPATFSFSNLGQKWTHSWLDYVQDDPAHGGSSVTRVNSGGGGTLYNTFSTTTGAFDAETLDGSTAYRIPATGTVTSYEHRMPDGSKEVYALSDGATTFPRKMFLTSVVDPQGNVTTINYDSSFRITSVVDAMGRSTTFTYGLSASPLLITQITDPFGRSSQFTYDTSGRLASITDPIGITSSFTYSATEPTFITQLTTPYGNSTFNDTPNPNDAVKTDTRSLTLTDPMGYTDYLYYYQDYTIVPTTDPPVPTGMFVDNGNLNSRNSFEWGKHAWAVCVAAGGCSISGGVVQSEDYSKADIVHWLHWRWNTNLVSRTLGSEKRPLESRVWTDFTGQSFNYASGTLERPLERARILDDGSTSFETYTYNAWGLPTLRNDGFGRVTTFLYAANNQDLTTVRQNKFNPWNSCGGCWNNIAVFTYNTQHEPLTYTDAAGKVWTYTYNAAGQLKTVKDPNLNITTYNYDTSSRLSTIVDANSQTVLTNTYDSADRIQTSTDSQGYTLTYAYDNLDRITSITYPDGTTDLYDYNFQSGPNVGTPSLELRKYTDRLGRVTTYDYDADRRLTSVTEPTSGSSTRTTGYSYYEDGTLKELTDANGNVTHWNIDIESRPTSKTYAYGTGSAQTETYTWETKGGRLSSITDALGQTKTFTYSVDNKITGITYTGTVNPTPNVTFTWDNLLPRISSMTDGLGTTNYSYTAFGTNGAMKLSSIDGPYSNDVISLTYDALSRLSGRNITGGNETFGYDAINRLTSHGTPLGSFTLGYLGETDQVTSQSVTNGTVTVSTGWGYDTNTNDRRLISISNSGVSRSYTLGYGSGPVNVYDIMSITDTAATGHPWATQSHGYTYDKIDRLLTESATTPGNSTFAYDNLDNATTWNTPASGSLSPTFNGLNQLSTFGTSTYSYDANGNTLSGDGTKTYKWDAENRLIEIDYVGSSAKSQFSYDGLGHRTVDAETVSGTTTTTRYLWCGSSICQTRDGSDNVFKRDLPEGEYNIGASQKLVYMPDQLGSVRDVIDATTGNLVQSYDYTPYGGVARSTGSVSTDYQYAGLFKHPASGLNLSRTRALDGNTGRWINRDPIRETGGINLYRYALASPINFIDPLGLNSQYSISVGGTGGFMYFGGGGGGSVGFSMGDHWWQIGQYQFFFSGQVNGMEGYGAFVGVGAGPGESTSNGSLPAGFTSGSNPYGEVDIFAWSASVQGNGHCITGFGGSGPWPKIGPGLGVWEGQGTSWGFKYSTRTTGQVYNDWLFNHSEWIARTFYNWF